MGATSKAHTATPRQTYDNENANDGFRSALAMQQTSTKHPDQQIFLGLSDGHGTEGRPIVHYRRDNIAIVSLEVATSLSTSAHFELLPTQHVPPAAGARSQKVGLDSLKTVFSRSTDAHMEAPSRDRIPLEAFPTEARSKFRFFYWPLPRSCK